MEGGGPWPSHRQGTLRTEEGEREEEWGKWYGNGGMGGAEIFNKKTQKIPSVKEFFYKNVLSLTQLENKDYFLCVSKTQFKVTDLDAQIVGIYNTFSRNFPNNTMMNIFFEQNTIYLQEKIKLPA